jgi:hypothetical protein
MIAHGPITKPGAVRFDIVAKAAPRGQTRQRLAAPCACFVEFEWGCLAFCRAVPQKQEQSRLRCWDEGATVLHNTGHRIDDI